MSRADETVTVLSEGLWREAVAGDAGDAGTEKGMRMLDQGRWGKEGDMKKKGKDEEKTKERRKNGGKKRRGMEK